MKRAYLINFTAIQGTKQLAIKSSLAHKKVDDSSSLTNDLKVLSSTTPIQSIALLKSSVFRVKIQAYNESRSIVLERVYETDKFGNLNVRIPLKELSPISYIKIYEVSVRPGIDIYLGHFIPIVLSTPQKIIISDFDKTLVDTRYHSVKEVYESLSKPLSYFPAIPKSLEIMKIHIHDNYTPFILSASPHFYERAIRDWLYQNEIYCSSIFLKDYRSAFSFAFGDLSVKDLKVHGFYKLKSLINIMLMTEIPDEIVLMGDHFETDPLIYLILKSFLEGDMEPRATWTAIKHTKPFKLTSKQNTYFLSQLYQLGTMLENKKPEVKIYIRSKIDEESKVDSLRFDQDFLERNRLKIKTYQS